MLKIYSKDSCPQCVAVAKLCDMRGIAYQVKKLGTDFTQEELLQMTNYAAKSYPQIFNADGAYIGGFIEFQKVLASSTETV